jgi:hypothetical protein
LILAKNKATILGFCTHFLRQNRLVLLQVASKQIVYRRSKSTVAEFIDARWLHLQLQKYVIKPKKHPNLALLQWLGSVPGVKSTFKLSSLLTICDRWLMQNFKENFLKIEKKFFEKFLFRKMAFYTLNCRLK